MATENEKVDIDPKDDDLDEPEPIFNENGEDTADWKAEAIKRHGMVKRFKTKFQKMKDDFEAYKKSNPEKKPEEAKQTQDKRDFDLAEKSYLLASGIKKEQFQLVWDEAKASGKSIDDLLNSPYFKEKLEMEASKAAIPSGTKRAGGAARDSVEYWLSKGEYPPKDQPELRRKVAAALAKQTEQKGKFSGNPIV